LHDPRLELWAGVECTVNRVHDRFHDQLILSGHHQRGDDLDRLAALGVRRLRFPILWERTAPCGIERADWSWSDARMGRLRALGVAPIVGLVHHGSGPRGTDLLDPGFPEKLAAYARAVAERYPEVEAWTPINEILTTARFSALYGHWYPHRRDIRDCVRAVLHQCRATALAMREIRAVNPRARLVQTEDFGLTSSTPALAYQARYENRRRKLALDLLFGRVDQGHPLWSHLGACGVDESELRGFVEAPTPPDLVGMNYYVTSDRHLDERLELYPAHLHGGNGRQRYVDVETVRVPRGIAGHGPLLRELWTEYQTPLAITEVHLGCAEEQQVHWLAEAWAGAEAARRDGVDVRAVTAWAAFGSFHWDKLVTSLDGQYEPGLFDVRSEPPRPSALAMVAQHLAAGVPPGDLAPGGRGWWHRPERVLYRPPIETCGFSAEAGSP
jgi:dTDP-4-dehydrorhamnose reductase